jgi:hypothetical protein
VSRVAEGLSLVAGGAVSVSAGREHSPLQSGLGERWSTRAPSSPTLSELFAASPRDSGWAGFLLPQIDRSKPVLWVQERMAILESGRIPAGTSRRRPHPCRSAGCTCRAVDDGGGRKMLRPLGRDRRSIWRPSSSGLYRDAAAGGRFGAVRCAVLACALKRDGEPQRRQDALADRKRAIAFESTGHASAGTCRVGRRVVPRPRSSAWPMDRRP